jgi:uncharacterized membrane protein
MNRLRGLMTAVGRLTRVDWAFVHFKAALGIMLMTPLVQLDSIKHSTTVWFLCIWATLTLIGFWVSVVGLVMSAQKYDTRHKGFAVEMTGLVLLMLGPAVFAAIQAGIWYETGQQKAVAITFCYVIMAAIFARMVMVKGAAKSRTVIYRYTEEVEND